MSSIGRQIELTELKLAMFPAIGKSGQPKLTERGDAMDRAWSVYRDRETAEQLLREAYLELPATNALMQGIHGHASITVEGALHLLARHKLADVNEATRLRTFLQTLNDLDVIAYSKRTQSVRLVAPMPGSESQTEEEPQPTLRIVEPDRPYSNLRHLREVLRSCQDFIWWADPHFDKRGFEPLTDEADAAKVTSIRILSGTRPAPRDVQEYNRFATEMQALGITVEYRIVAAPHRDWHDRYIITKNVTWNVPPLGAISKGSYSEFSQTTAPPFESWWSKAKPVESS